jgi:hypothetical protein
MTPTASKKQKFRRPIYLATSTLGIAIFVGCISPAMSISGRTGPVAASLVLPKTVRDLGRTSTRQERGVPFQIRNVGTRRLVINEVDAGCGCGDPRRKTVIIPPGESVEVTVTLDTRFANGPVENIATFTTSDPGHPRFDLIVRAWVDADEHADDREVNQRQQVSVLIHQQ